jgi:threonyl-tRNA synthetase
MSDFNNLSNEELIKIENFYKSNINDIFLQKKLSNIEKTQPWISVKNNTKSNKFSKKKEKKEIKFINDPYKFYKIPSEIKKIILNLCKKNDITLQTLAVKTNLPLHIIDNYINKDNSILDNYYLHILLKKLNFDLIKYIDSNK